MSDSPPSDAFVVLRQMEDGRWELVGEDRRQPGLPARAVRNRAIQEASGGTAITGEVYCVLPRSEWRVALDYEVLTLGN